MNNNLYGDCRTNICNNPSTIYAEIFKITLYKTVGTEKVYTTNNRFRFSVNAGNIVKEYAFVSNKEKFTFTDLTQDVSGVNVILNNNGDGTLTFYATHSQYYCPIIINILQSDGVINLTNFSDFTVKKSTLSNIVYANNLYTYNTTVTYANGWSDYSSSSKSIIDVNNNVVNINIKCKCSSSLVAAATQILTIDKSIAPNSAIRTSVFVWYLDSDGKTAINDMQGFAEIGPDGKVNIYNVTKAKEILIHFCYLK